MRSLLLDIIISLGSIFTFCNIIAIQKIAGLSYFQWRLYNLNLKSYRYFLNIQTLLSFHKGYYFTNYYLSFEAPASWTSKFAWDTLSLSRKSIKTGSNSSIRKGSHPWGLARSTRSRGTEIRGRIISSCPGKSGSASCRQSGSSTETRREVQLSLDHLKYHFPVKYFPYIPFGIIF